MLENAAQGRSHGAHRCADRNGDAAETPRYEGAG